MVIDTRKETQPDQRFPQPYLDNLGQMFQGFATIAGTTVEPLTRQLPQLIEPVTHTLDTAGRLFDSRDRIAQLAALAARDLLESRDPEGAIKRMFESLINDPELTSILIPLMFDLIYRGEIDKTSRDNTITVENALASDPNSIFFVASRHTTHGDHPPNLQFIRKTLDRVKKQLGDRFIEDHDTILVLAAKYVWDENPEFNKLPPLGKSSFNALIVPVIQDYLVDQNRYTKEEQEEVNTRFGVIYRDLLKHHQLAAVLIYPEGTRAEQNGPMNIGDEGIIQLIRMAKIVGPVVVSPVCPEFSPDYKRDGFNVGKLKRHKVGPPIIVPKGSKIIPSIDQVMTGIASLVSPERRGPYTQFFPHAIR